MEADRTVWRLPHDYVQSCLLKQAAPSIDNSHRL